MDKWLKRAKTEWPDEKTGLVVSFLPAKDMETPQNLPIKASYSALNCYYLTFIDQAFAKDQYGKLKEAFMQKSPMVGIKEYCDRSCWMGIDIDAGPIVFNLSPSGTTFSWKGKRHYLLVDVALVGEAIMLAMMDSGSSGSISPRQKIICWRRWFLRFSFVYLQQILFNYEQKS